MHLKTETQDTLKTIQGEGSKLNRRRRISNRKYRNEQILTLKGIF